MYRWAYGSVVSDYDVLVIGGGIAGRTAGSFTARAGLKTAVFDAGESILRRNAHLENFPGFPVGVNPRLLLDLMREQAERAGCEWVDNEVVDVDRHPKTGFVVKTADSDEWAYRGERVLVATPGRFDYLRELPVETVTEEGKQFVEATSSGRTSVDGIYVAGRMAGKPLQAAIAAGHGAEVAVGLLKDSDAPYAFDWSVPAGYFTERGREIPPGVEEVFPEDRHERERRSLEVMRNHFSERHPEEPDSHPDI
ncbi:oxidoreductase (homolog to thioredoxin-disulfide reductase) (plasmid) [Haloferax gibbonsii]|uniref:Oxidoreductase (Homolog to thioredoxin-disulfide reductase) n=1 Tax=Haloferax gibbonsii TaxID=35746 RepID=A0A871BJZ9_HALGI|nr:oxidoreductase (homolog to thioredoxin-disulfide reductase) [Haloferax gibbonsii]